MKNFKTLAMVLIMAAVGSSAFAAKEQFKINAAFYGATTNWSDYTGAAIKATYIKDGNLVIPMKETLNNMNLLDGDHLLIVFATFRDRQYPMVIGEMSAPFPKEITPKILQEEYEKAKDRPVIKTKHFEIVGAYYGGTMREIDVFDKISKFITEDGKLDASVESQAYEYNGWTPRDDRTLVVFYKDKDGYKVKTAWEKGGANLTLP